MLEILTASLNKLQIHYHSSLNIIRVTKSRIRWMGYVARTGEMNILVRKTCRRRTIWKI
jgi:hypothetical protein